MFALFIVFSFIFVDLLFLRKLKDLFFCYNFVCFFQFLFFFSSGVTLIIELGENTCVLFTEMKFQFVHLFSLISEIRFRKMNQAVIQCSLSNYLGTISGFGSLVICLIKFVLQSAGKKYRVRFNCSNFLIQNASILISTTSF